MATHSRSLFLENPHGQRSLVGYSPWGCKESDRAEVTEHARTHTCTGLTNSLGIFIAHQSEKVNSCRILSFSLLCAQSIQITCMSEH